MALLNTNCLQPGTSPAFWSLRCDLRSWANSLSNSLAIGSNHSVQKSHALESTQPLASCWWSSCHPWQEQASQIAALFKSSGAIMILTGLRSSVSCVCPAKKQCLHLNFYIKLLFHFHVSHWVIEVIAKLKVFRSIYDARWNELFEFPTL